MPRFVTIFKKTTQEDPIVFTPTLEQIFTPEHLRDAAFAIRSRSVGLDRETLEAYRNDPEKIVRLAEELHTGRYAPVPLRRVDLPKDATETRPIALGAVRDKIAQKCLAAALMPHFDRTFSDKSYGYRPDKGTLRAVNRVRDYLRKGYTHVYKTDIDDFFETIPHEKLLELLRTRIADRRIVDLVGLWLANGSFRSFDYLDHSSGIHQGDPLSPLLSNIYLDRMDRWLEEHRVEFVRFADDFVLLFKSAKPIPRVTERLGTFLATLGLRLGEDKSYAASVRAEGFTFLGCRFHGDHVAVDNDRLQKKVSRLYEMAGKKWDLARYIDEIDAFVEGLQRYYLKILDPDAPQFVHLESAYIDSAARRFAREFAAGRLRYKKEARPLALHLTPLTPLSKSDRKAFARRIVDTAKTLAKSPDRRRTEAALGRKKQAYAKEMALSSVLVVDRFGASLGVSKNKIVLKHKGRVAHTLPAKRCERIIVQTKGCSLSGALIHLCARRGIPVDFIDGAKAPYAMLHTYTQSYASRALRQLELLHDPAYRLAQAAEFVRAKLKNQRNYLKYLDKHHRQVDSEIDRIAAVAGRVREARSVEALMGLEGGASALYWEALGRIVADKTEFPGRVTRGAVDPVNSALNYGYALLYGEIQHALVRAGLALHISYLHTLDDAKPTLVFDFIEPFRSFVVDRTVFSMVNRDEPVRTDKEGRLTQKARRLVADNVLERLGSHTRHDGASKRLRTVIADEAYAFARAIDAGERYRPFIGRY
jgi:group II intron reverse transcriptase/maturase/CRISPR-associated endonuclease Cas1